MGFFSRRKRSKSAGPVVGYFGKHPSAGDFLRHNASSPEVLGLDDWLASALAAGPRLMPAWEATFGEGATLCFLCHRGAGRCLLGVLSPSHDRSGRLFPLILFAELDSASIASSCHALPHEAFLQAARALLDRRSSCSWEELRDAALRLGPPDDSSLLEARREHDHYLESTTTGVALDGIFGTGSQTRRAFSALQLIARSASASGALPAYGVRCPLGANVQGDAGLWLALLGQAAPALLPNVVWSDRALLFHHDLLPPKALAAALDPTWQDDGICDLATTTTAASVELPPREATLATLLRRQMQDSKA